MKLSTILKEVYNKEVADAQRKNREAEKELLLQIQLMSYDSLIKDIIAKIPTAKWSEFKTQTRYRGKIVYETKDGYAELWFRTDGMVVCSDPVTGRRTKCESDEKIYNWLAENPPLITDQEDITMTGAMIDEIAAKIHKVFVADPIKKFKHQSKVVGNQYVNFKQSHNGFEIWYRPSGEVFCKTPDGKFYTFNKLKQFERFLKAHAEPRSAVGA